MTQQALIQFGVYFGLLLALAIPLGIYIERVLNPSPENSGHGSRPLERCILRLAGVDPSREMGWKEYAISLLAFNLVGLVAVYALLRAQAWLPLNPNGLPATTPEIAFNTAVSFASNTNWQAYGGETTLSHLSQMLGLTVQNFVSAATGIAVLAALIRGLTRSHATTIGNFWVDLTKTTLYILLPLASGLALLLVSQGVVQTLTGSVAVAVIDPTVEVDGQQVLEQVIALGPAASQVAIKQLGTNGGGFFNVNSAHPLENPTPLSNLLQLLAILLIPTALCFSFGAWVKDKRQGIALVSAMFAILLPALLLTAAAEQSPGTAFGELVDVRAGADQPGGNMEGKETRFGIANSVLWAVATTAASNGSVNSMHDSYTPIGGLPLMFLMQTGEVVFGGVGSGLYGMLIYAIVAVFIAGLMVGRTPEYLGKRIEPREMRMACLAILVPSLAVLAGTAIACSLPSTRDLLSNPGAHGFSEVLYAFTSGANNNGSAFAGLTASGTFFATAIGVCMIVGRYWVIVAVLAIAGSMARKKVSPPTAGTLPTHDVVFVVLLVATIVLVGALTFFPALALGPVADHVSLTLR